MSKPESNNAPKTPDEDCIFCDIIDGKLPCEKVYEDDYVLAFRSISPIMPGHTLVIPKIHVRNILDCDAGTLGYVMAIVQKLSQDFIKSGKKSVKILQNNEAPHQEVFHLHFHVIPY